MPIIAAIIGGGAMLATSALSSSSARSAQREANVTNVDLNRENREWNAGMAQQSRMWDAGMVQQQREWLGGMASSAHQREVADLRAAGLNPILSAGGGGAVTPGTGVPSSPTPQSSAAQVGSEGGISMGDVGGAASSAYAAAQQRKLMDLAIKKANADTETAELNAIRTLQDTTVNALDQQQYEAKFAYYNRDKDQRPGPANPQEEMWEAEYQQKLAQTQQTQLQNQAIPTNIEVAKAQLRSLIQQTNIGQSAEAKAKIEEQINKSTFGEILIWIDRLSKSVQGIR